MVCSVLAREQVVLDQAAPILMTKPAPTRVPGTGADLIVILAGVVNEGLRSVSARARPSMGLGQVEVPPEQAFG
jgi:hypothetical protein